MQEKHGGYERRQHRHEMHDHSAAVEAIEYADIGDSDVCIEPKDEGGDEDNVEEEVEHRRDHERDERRPVASATLDGDAGIWNQSKAGSSSNALYMPVIIDST